MKNVFVSGPVTAQQDLSILADALQEQGIQVWLPDRLLPGTASDLMDEILSMIKRCDLFVALMDQTNPNVLFELGLALGSGKSVLLVASRVTDVPFDVRSLRVLVIDFKEASWITQVVEQIKSASIKTKHTAREFDTAQERLRQLCDDEAVLDAMDPREFERCISEVFTEMGFRAHLLGARNDHGFDVAIEDFCKGQLAAVEIRKKNRNASLSVSEVQRIIGAAVTARARFAIIVTSGGFTSSATYCAQASPIRVLLLTIDDLAKLNRDDLIRRALET